MATLAAAPDEKARAALWRGITADKAIGAELRQFSAAVQQRFGDDTVRAMLRSGGGLVEAASVPREHHAALAAVSRTVHTLQEGRARQRPPGRGHAARTAPDTRIPARLAAVRIATKQSGAFRIQLRDHHSARATCSAAALAAAMLSAMPLATMQHRQGPSPGR